MIEVGLRTLRVSLEIVARHRSIASTPPENTSPTAPSPQGQRWPEICKREGRTRKAQDMKTILAPERSLSPGWGATLLATFLVVGCTVSEQSVRTPPPYTPNYTYKTEGDASPRDITIAVINPIIKGFNLRGAEGQEMLAAIPTALADMISAKGMKYRGPVESREAMTFVDKKGSDLGLYAEVDLNAGWQPFNVQHKNNNGAIAALTGNMSLDTTCDVKIWYKGRVSFVVIEPLSNETMWRKTVDIKPAETVVQGQTGQACGGSGGQVPTMPGGPLNPSADRSPDGAVSNTYRRGLERAFWETMKAVDTYMNGDEFELLKKQAKELRDKKVY